MAADTLGICPNCEARRGPVGDPCPEAICGRKDYRFIPMPWYKAAKEFAARKQRPLDPLLGRCIDRYLLAGKIGEGGMGSVYLAIQRPLNREVALKVISGLEMTQTTVARFEREARAISVLDHPNIVRLYDYGVGELEFRIPYMALEYVKHGRTLRRALAQMHRDSGGAPIPGEVVLSIFSQVLHALDAAHRAGIIHRDMKPDNVMLAPVSGNPYFVKVLDFGLAKALADVSGFDGTVSRTGQFLGTPVYMAPEQVPRKGQPVVDGRADLYAVAVMLFEVFTGVRPFDGATVIEVLAKKVDPEYDPFSFPEARGLPRPLKEFLKRGMAPDPGQRYAGALEMLAAFQEALSGRRATAVGLVPGRPGSSDERPPTPPSPGPEDSAALEPTSPIRGEAEVPAPWPEAGVPAPAGPESDGSTVLGPRPKVRWPTIAVVGALVAAAAGAGGVFLATSRHARPEGVPLAQPPATTGADAKAPASEGPVPAPVSAQATQPVAQPAPEPAPAPIERPASPPAATPAPTPVVKPAGLRVRFESQPSGAEVYLAGRRLGTTPFDALLDGPAGPREFSFRLKGYADSAVRANVTDGGVVRASMRRKAVAPPPAPRPKFQPRRDDYPEP